MLKLENIHIKEEGRKVLFDYTASKGVQKYLNLKNPYYIKYGVNVSEVPQSILAIPFLCNMLPIAWFGGFNIELSEVDEDFFNAMNLVKSEFEKQFPDYKLTGGLIAERLVKNKINGNQSAMLFSGGVDAYATYIRIYDSTPDLVTILGADIEIEDKSQWNTFTSFIENEKLLNKNKKEYIETNVRTFYTYQVELLLKDIGWWGKVQHGLSLLGSLAPISYVNSYTNIYIASSYTDNIDIAWGSTPNIDESISWAGVKIHHDGYELKRQDKVDLITQFSTNTKTNFKLRVCYSELRDNFNCSHCEKCYRTILGIILNGKNPNDYGFKVDKNVYSEMFKVLNIGGASRGMQYFWWELMEKAKNSETIYVFENEDIEKVELNRIRNGEIHELIDYKINNPNKFIYKLKFIARNKFSTFYRLFKKLRN
ncbi:hypothetical protein L3X39_08980 [Sabulilitoribacter multivorans]|uniref:7-cyano-7-deazaguanine synthase (Queuosine biosynthesis) n=1 Tax=Flaviramulus multivorans TaxID=1304750 RepID=A0ABS9IJK1_9FLAO|nr:hypothetical protein [Flaviramulus multivorans]MCF7560771.1 hypothetical protein [Flaviramulus multivorans]